TVLNCGGNPDIYDVRRWSDLPLQPLIDYLACPEVKAAIHAQGDWQFADDAGPVSEGLMNDLMADVTPLFPQLLEEYRMLFYTGNFDMSCGFCGTEQILEAMKYPGWSDTRRLVWTETAPTFNADLPQTMGFAKSVGNLTQAVIPDSGHQVPVAKPVVSRQMLQQWIAKAPFAGYMPVTLRATTKWLDSGISLRQGATLLVKAMSGHWSANPANGFFGADGDKRHIAKVGYTLPSEKEGALCGRISATGKAFLIGAEAQWTVAESGNLFLCINDDLNGEYGAGFSDNEGSVTVAVSVS
ncbi:MAG: S10 family peptidase, partial [Desulfuromonadales bacterium]|nr:S10 family peptidase [Desulfuromonadales bacterium]